MALLIVNIAIAFMLAGVLVVLCLIYGLLSDGNARGERMERQADRANLDTYEGPGGSEWWRRN